MSDRLAKRKIDNILSTGAEIVLASNAGCLLQIQREVRQRKLPLVGDAPDGFARTKLPGEQPNGR